MPIAPFYMFFFIIVCLFLYCLESRIIFNRQNNFLKKNYLTIAKRNKNAFFIASIFCVLPIVFVYGLRYGIGTDYFAYVSIYEFSHNIPFIKYCILHFAGFGAYYTEIGYHLFNRIAPNFVILQFLVSFTIFSCIFFVLKNYENRINIALAVFIYLTMQFVYSTNGIRFGIAIMFIFISYEYIVESKPFKFLLCIAMGTLFHKTSLMCIVLYFLKEFKSKKINRIRNLFMVIIICSLPILFSVLLNIFSNVLFFAHYFETDIYSATGSGGTVAFLIHTVPVILPLIICVPKAVLKDGETKVWLRLYLMEIPFRMFGLLNAWFTRVARFAEVSQIVFIPLVLSNIKNKKIKNQLLWYYVCWYTFNFFYYIMVRDERFDVYKTVFGMS